MHGIGVEWKERTAMGNPVTWFEINSVNSVALRDFYADLFGWQMQSYPGDPPYALVDTGPEGAIGGGIGEADGPSRVLFYIEVDDPQAYLRSDRDCRRNGDRSGHGNPRRYDVRALRRSGGQRSGHLQACRSMNDPYLGEPPRHWMSRQARPKGRYELSDHGLSEIGGHSRRVPRC